jgi:TATA-binding protein-associated factor
LCIHPCLVISSDHYSFRQRIINDKGSSGKLVALAKLLVDSGVIFKDECIDWKDILIHTNSSFEVGNIDNNDIKIMKSDDDDDDDDDDDEDDDDSRYDFKVVSNSNSITINEGEEEEEEEEEENHKDIENHKDVENLKNENIILDDDNISINMSANSNLRPLMIKKSKTLVKNKYISPSTIIPQRTSSRLANKNIIDNNNHLKELNNQISNKITNRKIIHRCLIFAQHKSALNMIEKCVMNQYFPGIHYERLDGDVSPINRGLIAQRFNNQKNSCNNIHNISLPKDDIRILLMSTKSCGLGLNLVAADTVIFVEHDWNPYIDLQAMDRVHRIGQDVPVTVYRLLAETTIEARLINLQNLKINIVNEIINDKNSIGITSNNDNNNADNKRNNFKNVLLESVRISSTIGGNSSNDNSNNGPNDAIDEYESMNLDSFLESI